MLALGLITWVFVTSRRGQPWLHIALGLITAGAIGNLYDRAVFGAVRDFLKFTVSWYPFIFNIADVLLCVGVPLLNDLLGVYQGTGEGGEIGIGNWGLGNR